MQVILTATKNSTWLKGTSPSGMIDSLRALFSFAVEAYPELSSQKVLKSGESVPIYNDVLLDTCDFISFMPLQVTDQLEALLFENVLSRHFFVHRLTVDIWSFLAQSAPSSYIVPHAQTLAAIITDLQSSCQEHFLLCTALNGLLRNCPAALTEVSTKYSPTVSHDFCHLWASLIVVPSNGGGAFASAMISWSMEQCHAAIIGEESDLISGLRAAAVVFNHVGKYLVIPFVIFDILLSG